MRFFVVSSLGNIAWLVLIAEIVVGGIAGGRTVENPWGPIVGLLIGFAAGVLSVGVVFELLDIRSDLRAIRERIVIRR